MHNNNNNNNNNNYVKKRMNKRNTCVVETRGDNQRWDYDFVVSRILHY